METIGGFLIQSEVVCKLLASLASLFKMAPKTKKTARKNLSITKANFAKILEKVSLKSEAEVFQAALKYIESTWKVPLKLDVRECNERWQRVKNSPAISSSCKIIYDDILSVIKNEKGTDKMPKALSKVCAHIQSVMSNKDNILNQMLKVIFGDEHSKLCSCLVMAIKDVLWNFIICEKKPSTTRNATVELREASLVDDNISLYRLGSFALYRIKKQAWRKIKSKLLSKKKLKLMQNRLKLVEAFEETDSANWPCYIQQNRNLLIMKNSLLPHLALFSKEFHQVVNSSSYAKYGKTYSRLLECSSYVT